MNPETELQQLLSAHNFALVRQRKHKVYRNPEGLPFVTASTPSDRRWARNALCDLRRVLRTHGLLEAKPEPTQDVPQPEPIEDSWSQVIADPSFLELEASAIEAQPVVQPVEMTAGEWRQWLCEYKKELADQEKAIRFCETVKRLFHYWQSAREAILRQEIGNVNMACAVKKAFVEAGYRKTKIRWYTVTLFQQGIQTAGATLPVVRTTQGTFYVSMHAPLGMIQLHDTKDAPYMREAQEWGAFEFRIAEA